MTPPRQRSRRHTRASPRHVSVMATLRVSRRLHGCWSSMSEVPEVAVTLGESPRHTRVGSTLACRGDVTTPESARHACVAPTRECRRDSPSVTATPRLPEPDVRGPRSRPDMRRVAMTHTCRGDAAVSRRRHRRRSRTDTPTSPRHLSVTATCHPSWRLPTVRARCQGNLESLRHAPKSL